MFLNTFKTDTNFIPYINTGTIYDILTGKFKSSTDNRWVLDGGLSPCAGISGRGNLFKSSLAGSLLSRAMIAHPEAHAIVYDSELNVSGVDRYDEIGPRGCNVSDRITFTTPLDYNLTSFYEEFLNLVNERIKHKKDFMVDSPFRNPRDGKPYKVWIPAFVLIDSFSRARSSKSDKKTEEKAVDDSSQQTAAMEDGGVKTRIMNDIVTRSAKAGIYVIMTAHIGDKIDMNSYMPTPKQMQYMKQSDKLKNVGSAFTFLTTTLTQMLRAQVLQDSNKNCLYSTEFSSPTEISEVDAILVRCKNNASGLTCPFIMSQFQGLLDAVTNLNILRSHNNFGLEVKGNNTSFSTILTPNQSFSRNTVRDFTDSHYEVSRALELLSQLCFIQTFWNTWNLPPFIRMDVRDMAELLTTSKTLSMNRVLNSTGVWSTSKQERERMTIMDVLMFLDKEFGNSKKSYSKISPVQPEIKKPEMVTEEQL